MREIAQQLGVDATGLYRVANKLIVDGRLRKDGTRLYPLDAAATPPPRPPSAADGATEPAADDTARGSESPAEGEPTPQTG